MHELLHIHINWAINGHLGVNTCLGGSLSHDWLLVRKKKNKTYYYKIYHISHAGGEMSDWQNVTTQLVPQFSSLPALIIKAVHVILQTNVTCFCTRKMCLCPSHIQCIFSSFYKPITGLSHTKLCSWLIIAMPCPNS